MGINNIKVLRALSGNSISAKITAAAVQGQIVNRDPATIAGKAATMDSAVAFRFATGKKGWILERNVVAAPIPLETLMFMTDFISPDVIGNNVSARKAQEYEVEGPDLVLVAGTNGQTFAPVALTSLDVGEPAVVVSAAPHLLTTGQTVTLAGITGATPAGNGTYVVTVLDATHFEIPLKVTVAGTGGTVTRAAITANNQIDNTTAIDTEVSTSGGAISVRQPTEERYGWIRGQLTPMDPANPCRLLIEVDGD